MKSYIGIDLGTTNTVASYLTIDSDGIIKANLIKIKQIYNDDFKECLKETLPSVLYVDKAGNEYIGEVAKFMKAKMYDRVIYNSKSYIGSHNHFWKIDDRLYTPEDIAAKILKKVKEDSERVLDTKLDSAVITVPASFNHDQIEATEKAAKMAGFSDQGLMFISEPTAALLDLINDERTIPINKELFDSKAPKKVLVFDLGGGTCDVSIMNVNISDSDFDVEEIAISPHTKLGGVDFDLRGVLYLISKYKINDYIDFENNEDVKRYVYSVLAIEVEKARIMFTEKESGINDNLYEGYIENFVDNKPFSFKLLKGEYDECIKALLTKDGNFGINIINPIIDTLKKADLKKEEIDVIYLVGGMTMYYPVQKAIENFFGRKVMRCINPVFSVAKGAALYNYYSKNRKNKENGNVIIYPVVAENIYLDVKNGLPVLLVKQGTRAPYEKIYENIVKVDNATGIKLDIYSGKCLYDPKMKRMRSVQLIFRNIVKPGTPISLKVVFDKNRILHFEAWVSNNENQKVDIRVGEGVSNDGD